VTTSARAFEQIEADPAGGTRPSPTAPPAGSCARPWSRTDHAGGPGGGGVMAIDDARPRCSRRSASTLSTVHGEFAPEFRKDIPGAADDPRFLGVGRFR